MRRYRGHAESPELHLRLLMKTPDWRRGLAWKNGKLYAFEPSSVLVMRMWPDMLAWRKTKTKPWAATRRHADERLTRDFLEPGLMERYALLRTQYGGPIRWEDCFDRMKLDFAAALPAVQTIPDRERAIAASFSDRRWHLLAMMARCPGATDLLEANPALGFALANSWVLKDPPPTQPMRAARALLRRSQGNIQAWLNLPGTERVRRILRKVDRAALSGRMLPLIQRALWRPEVQNILAHLPVINSAVIRFLTDPDCVGMLTPRFLLDVLERSIAFHVNGAPMNHHACGLWRDAIRMARTMSSTRPAELRSMQHLQRWHDGLVRDYNRYTRGLGLDGAAQLSDVPYRPPFAETFGIQPLLNFNYLCQEGREMHHCVASYHSQIVAGQYFVYRVTSPIRATLGLRRLDGEWQLDQLVEAGNAPVDVWGCDDVMRRLTESDAVHFVRDFGADVELIH